MVKIVFIAFLSLLASACGNQQEQPSVIIENKKEVVAKPVKSQEPIVVGAARIEQYFRLVKDKRVALVVNQTSMVGSVHLVDTLLSLGIDIKRIFAPEHGFRGKADAGEQIKDGKDSQTGLTVTSLYGKQKKPTKAHLTNIDLVIFDIQDVGARFYTYISTMHYVMEACAEQDIAFLVLDRPNPNGHYVDGPILKDYKKSFVGMHPVPIVHGMTIAEYARMINGEKWLAGGKQCRLLFITCLHYDHQRAYELPIKPSPNLPNNRAIYLYPSLCLFEGTIASVGRGTNTQFQVYGHPVYRAGIHRFKPVSMEGAKYPKHEGTTCYGHNLSEVPADTIRNRAKLNLSYITSFYNAFPDKERFFLENNFFDLLAGDTLLRAQIRDEVSPEFIYHTWADGLKQFKIIRSRYLLYEDFD